MDLPLRLISPLLCLLFALSTACGKERNDEPKQESCSELHLEVAQGRPLQLLRLEGVPEGFAELLAAEVTSATGAKAFTLVAREEESDEIWLHAPIHPEALVEGGEVSLALVDAEGRSCPALPFLILPLDGVPGTVAAAKERIAHQLEGIAAFFQTSIEELRAMEVHEIPEHLLPLYLAQDSLEADPNSLQALLDGSAPILEGEALSLDLLDALLAEIDLVRLLDESLAALTGPPAEGSDVMMLRQGLSSTGGGPENAYQLHMEMEMAQWGESFSGDGPLGDGVRKTVGAVGLLGSLPHPVARAGSMAVGSAAFALTKGAEAAANLLPSRLVSIDFELNPLLLYEDDESSGQWQEVMVVAASKGWKLDRSVLEGLLQFTQVKGGYSAWMNRFSPPTGLREALGEHLLTEAVNATIASHADDSGILTIAPKQTRPIDITEEPWSFGTVHFGLREEGREGYRIDPSWEGELRGEVQVGTALGKFGGRHIYTRKDAGIEPVRITIDPTSVVAEPGETITFSVKVHAADKTASIQAERGSIIHEQRQDGTYQVVYTAPLEEDGLPDTLTVRSESTGGFLVDPSRRPSVRAFIRSRSPLVEIEPRSVCVKSGEKQTFTARVENLDDPSVNWSVDYGSITRAGLYTAPSEPGVATVRATSAADPSVFDTVSVNVGPCNCLWSMQVGGRGSLTLGGTDIHLAVEDGAISLMSFLAPIDLETGASMIGVEAADGLSVGGRGSFLGWVRGSHLDIQRAENADEFASISTITITLSKFDQSGDRFEIEGTIDGTVYWERVLDEGPEDERDWPGHLSLQFHGTMDRLPSPGSSDDSFQIWCNPF